MDDEETPPSRVRPSLAMTPKRHSMPAPPRSAFPPKSPGQIYVPTKDGWRVASSGSPVRGTPPQMPRTEAQIHDDEDRCSLRSRHSVGESRLSPKFPVLHHAQPFSGMRSGMAADTASTVSSTIRIVGDSPEGSPNITPPSTISRKRSRSLSAHFQMLEAATAAEFAKQQETTRKASTGKCVIM